MYIMDLKNIQPPCEQVPHKLIKKVSKKAKYVSIYEIDHKNTGREYKQLADKKSLEWFCNEELHATYKRWNCKRKYKPSLYEQEIKRQLNSPTSLLSQQINVLNTKIPIAKTSQALERARIEAQSALNAHGLGTDASIANSDRIWQQRIEENKKLIDQLTDPSSLLSQQVNNEAERLKDLVSSSYLDITKTALCSFGRHSSLANIVNTVQAFTSHTDRILNNELTIAQAQAILPHHRGIFESARLHLRSYEPEEELKKKGKGKNWKKKAKKRKAKIIKLKAIIAEGQIQDKEIVKKTRNYQNHALIWKIDQALTEKLNGKKPVSIEVWNELENNYLEYDGEDGEDPIIQSATNGVIEWRSKYGNNGKFTFTSFSKILSVVRNKYSKNSN